MSKSYSPEFKLQVVLEAFQSDRTEAGIARAYDIHPVTLSNWKKKLKENGSKAFERDNELKEKALVLALMQMVVQGVSTRRVKEITPGLCGCKFSKSTVSRLSEDLDKQVEAWAGRPLDGQCYPLLVLDGMQVKVRRQGAVRSTTILLAVGISEEGQREILGLDTAFGETSEAWRRFIRTLKERGLSGVEVATSDAHEGLVAALREAFPSLIWQRCQAHFRRNVLDRTPASCKERMHELSDRILEAPSLEEARQALTEAQAELDAQADQALWAHFLDFRRDIPDLMRSADFFTLPSRRDSCPLVLLEAMASGLPIITSQQVGTVHLVEDSESGFVLEHPNDQETLQQGLIALRDDPEYRKEMGQAARAVARAHSWQKMSHKYLQLMEQHAQSSASVASY